MFKAEQVIVEETFEDGRTQTCVALQVGDKLVFADNGDTISIPKDYIKIIKRFPKWVDLSDTIIDICDIYRK